MFMKNRRNKSRRVRMCALAVIIALILPSVLCSCGGTDGQKPFDKQPGGSQKPPLSDSVETIARPQLLSFSGEEQPGPAPSVRSYKAEPDLSNVENLDRFFLSDEEKAMLEKNLFAVSPSYTHEFFETYEMNRYFQIPNFVTVDSLMHTYHLYFSLLLNRTEKNYLADELKKLSKGMLNKSLAQYEALAGTKWEKPAKNNVAFFAVAVKLQDDAAEVPQIAEEPVAEETARIYAAGGISESPVAADFLDYTQFKPRGYYEGNEVLERYFRTMMWYGQINFTQKNDLLNRSALLTVLAMDENNRKLWEKLHTVTACFAGASDDLGYYEYAPAINAAYGSMPGTAALAENENAYQKFVKLAGEMRLPAINSIPVWEGTKNIQELKKGFRFMGQRFTVDAAVMQRLVYSNVKENSGGEKRMLPDTLDVPAALGSDAALKILEEQGAMEFSGYRENMKALRRAIAEAEPDSWGASLYSGWLYTLAPLLLPKGEGWPSFMTSRQWQKKDLETYCGSFTELKHDTVLYSKQVVAEMGGGPDEEMDDRGYVQPEPEVYRRFACLARQTAQGLGKYDVLSGQDKELLLRLCQLAERLLAISQKELREEMLTDEEYEFIRAYGGTLEHFWYEAAREKCGKQYVEPGDIPASLITDVATDPNGTVLQIANAQPGKILVIVPIDGRIRLASGIVYNFYQFEHLMDDRLTDSSWRIMTGEWPNPESNFWERDESLEKPEWTKSYWREEK